MTQQSSRLDIIIDSRQAQRNGEQLRITLNNLVVVGDQAANSMSGAGTAARAAGVAFAALGAGRVAGEIIRLTDAFKSMQGSLALVSSSSSVASDSFQKLLTMANNTGSSLESTVSLYTRLANATRGAGYTTEQLLGVTDAINKAFVISGATMQEASNAAIQLSQGLASGTLRGEELNSVMEQGPRITRALAEHLGVTNGQIRQMAADGKITAEVVTNALLGSLASLNGELERMPRRFEQASTALKNNFLAAVGQIDIDPLISSVDALADSLAKPEVISGIQAIATGLGNVVAVGGDGLKTVVANTDALMAITGAYAAKVGVGLVGALGLAVKARYDLIVATKAQIVTESQAEVASTAAAAQASRRVVAEEAAALAISQRSLAEAFATRSTQANALIQIQAVQAQLVADRALETQRLQNQISDTGRRQSLARLAEIRRTEAIVTAQQTAARAALGQATTAEVIAQSGVTAANARLVTSREADTIAMNAQNAAQNRLNAAQQQGVITRTAGSLALSAIGGPMGAVTLGLAAAAGAYLYFRDSADTATKSLIDQNLTLDDSISKFAQLNAEQQRSQKFEWIKEQKASLEESGEAIKQYRFDGSEAFLQIGNSANGYREKFNAMVQEVREGKRSLDSVTEWARTNTTLTDEQINKLADSATAYSTSAERVKALSEMLERASGSSQSMTQSTNTLVAAQSKSSNTQAVSVAEWEKYIGQLTKARDLVGANAAAEAAYNAVKMGANAAQVAQAKAIATQTDLLGKYQDAIKEGNRVEQDRIKVLLVASYTAMQAAEDVAAAKKKADGDAAKSAEDSAKRQITAIEKVAAASYAALMAKPAAQQNLSGYGLLTNGGTAPTAPVSPRKTPQQMADEAAAQATAGTTPNKTPKGPSEKGALSAALSAFDALYKKADPAAQAVRDLTEAQEKLQIALSKGKITQEQYGVALGQASRDYAAVIAKTGELSQAEQYRTQILKQLQNQQEAANAAAAAVGMGSERAGREQERLKLEKETNDKLLDLRTELANAQGEKQRQALQAQIDITNELYPQQVAIMENGWAQVDAAQANWMNGITAGWDNYQDKVQDVAAQTQAVMTDSLDAITSGYGSAFSKMALDGQTFGEVTRGVFDSLARTVLDGLGQMGVQWLVLQGIKMAFGQTEQALHFARMAGISTEMTAELAKETTITAAKVTGDGIATGSTLAALATTTTATVAAAGTTLASWLPAALVASVGTFGAAAIVGGAGLLAAFALFKGFSEGGYTGPGGVNQPAGIVHKGEVVWSQADINRSGGVAAVEAMRRGDAMPAGFSSSGPSASAKSSSSSRGGSQATQPQTVVNLHEDASRAGQVQTSTGPDGKQMMEIFVSNIRSQSSATKAFEQTYGLKRVGR